MDVDNGGDAADHKPASNGTGPAADATTKESEDAGSSTNKEASGKEGDDAAAGAGVAPKKKVYSKVPLTVEANTAAWSKAQIDEAVLAEAQMANQVMYWNGGDGRKVSFLRRMHSRASCSVCCFPAVVCKLERSRRGVL